jgi:hypothetical protein
MVIRMISLLSEWSLLPRGHVLEPLRGIAPVTFVRLKPDPHGRYPQIEAFFAQIESL